MAYLSTLRRAAACLAFVLAGAMPDDPAADIVPDLRLDTPAVAGGMTFSVYLPPDHDDGRRFPVAYLLHGLGASARQWRDSFAIETAMDDLIARGTLAPMILVMPDAGRSWYVDSVRFGGPGDFETAIVRDLVARIDATWPTRAAAAHRAIVGYSMGGHGALRLAFRHPETFAATVALAPAIWSQDGVSARSAPMRALSDETRARWFPNTAGAPFDADILAAQSPFAEVAALHDLATPPRVMLAVGDEDHLQFHDGTVEIYLALRGVGLEPVLRVIEGGHDPAFVRDVLDDALGFLDATIGMP